MVVIFDNVRVTLGKNRDLIGINFVWWKGLFAKRENRKGLFRKKFIKSGGSLENREKGRGLKAKLPFLFLPSMQNRGGAPARRRQPDSGALGLGGGQERGGRGREVLWWGSRPHLGLGWRAEAGRSEPVAAGGNGCGGGIAG